jgi:hypothetical protein
MGADMLVIGAMAAWLNEATPSHCEIEILPVEHACIHCSLHALNQIVFKELLPCLALLPT